MAEFELPPIIEELIRVKRNFIVGAISDSYSKASIFSNRDIQKGVCLQRENSRA
jgi:sialic acid synthase SpsE